MLKPEAERLGVALGEARWEDDAYDAKLGVVESTHVHLVGFTFGCPTSEIVERLHRADIQVAVTVTTVLEAELAADAGTDLLIVQGTEAGGHQGSFMDLPGNHRPMWPANALSCGCTAHAPTGIRPLRWWRTRLW